MTPSTTTTNECLSQFLPRTPTIVCTRGALASGETSLTCVLPPQNRWVMTSKEAVCVYAQAGNVAVALALSDPGIPCFLHHHVYGKDVQSISESDALELRGHTPYLYV